MDRLWKRIDPRLPGEWALLALAAWLVLTPAVLGFLAGSSVDRWCGPGCFGARLAFPLAGALAGWAIARSVLRRMHRPH